MSLTFYTNNPTGLLRTFKNAIDNKHVVTWSYDSDGDFTHTTEQWNKQAWMRPVVGQGQLTLNFLGNPRTSKSMRELYAIFHGRFAESMLVHCDELFTNVTATALATPNESVSKAA
jgi:hypothetical protein